MSHDDFDTLAVIDCSINYNIGIKNGKLIIHAYAFVNPHKSWMDEKNVFVLKHEQGHFDIAEIFARRFEEIVNDTSIADPGMYITFVNKTVEQIFSLLTEEDKKYDFYTMNTLGREYYDNWILATSQIVIVKKGLSICPLFSFIQSKVFCVKKMLLS